jgi:hypothetical protein
LRQLFIKTLAKTTFGNTDTDTAGTLMLLQLRRMIDSTIFAMGAGLRCPREILVLTNRKKDWQLVCAAVR